jgi:hypothetical protein
MLKTKIKPCLPRDSLFKKALVAIEQVKLMGAGSGYL